MKKSCLSSFVAVTYTLGTFKDLFYYFKYVIGIVT